MRERLPTDGTGDRPKQHEVELPVELAEGTGLTCSVSTTCVVFRTDRPFRIDERVRFVLVLGHPDGLLPSRVYCEGVATGIEPCAGQWEITVDIAAFRFQGPQ